MRRFGCRSGYQRALHREQLAELDTQVPVYTQKLSGFGKQLSGIEEELFGPDYDPTVPVAKEEEDFLAAGRSGLDKEKTEEDPSEKAARSGRDLLDEVVGHNNSLQRDVEVVKRTMALLEGKLKRGSA